MKMGWFKAYKASFIDAHRFRPVVHVITGIMCLGYTLEYFHHLSSFRHKNVRRAALSEEKH